MKRLSRSALSFLVAFVFGAISFCCCINAETSSQTECHHTRTYEVPGTRIEATCTDDGSYVLACRSCDMRLDTVTIPAGHYTTEIQKEENVKWHSASCLCGEVVAYETHVWDSGVYDTETEKTLYTCSSCGETSFVIGGIFGVENDVNDFSWVLDETGLLTISGTGTMKDYTSSSLAPWYSYRSSIKTATIAEGVTSIGNYVFYDCENLTSIEIPVGVTSIGDYTFAGCSCLTSIEIPANVTSIGNSTFKNCSGLTSIKIPAESKLTSIGDSAFYNCSSLKSIGIPAGVTSIGKTTFYGCSNLTDIDIPTDSKLTSVGDRAFFRCSSLTSIEIPAGVTSIGTSAFYGCSSLKDIHISDIASWCNISFEGYFDNPFYYANNLYVNGAIVTELVIPEQVTDIGNYAFSGCSSLTSIDLHSGVTSIGEGAYLGCSSLTSIDLHSGVTSIGKSAFSECSSLTSIEIPASVTSIGDAAFERCSSLTSIEIPVSVTSIGNYAFSRCSSLTSIEIPVSVTSIGNSAFSECSCLTSIELPVSVTSIGNYAFSRCSSLTSIDLPANLTSVGESAFYGCSESLLSIVVDEGNTNFHSKDNCLIETATKTLILGCQNSKIPKDGSVTSIGAYAFCDCNGLTSIEIPANVTSIGNSAFWECSSLTSIELPASVTNISAYAFSGCSSLTSIDLPANVTSIGDYAFAGCSSLTSIELPVGVTSIGNFSFYGCSSLTNMEIPVGVTSIGVNAFLGCSSLTSIIFESATTEIYDSASTISDTATIYGYAGSTAEAYATTHGRTFVPFATDVTTVFEFGMTFTPDEAQAGTYTPVASLNRQWAGGTEVFDFLYAQKSTGALAIKDTNGAYQPLYDEDGMAVTVGTDEISIAIIYDNVGGLIRYYVNGCIPYYGESKALANDVAIYNTAIGALEAVSDTLTTLDSVCVSRVYNINASATADFIGIQQKEGDVSTVRILSGVDMLYYGSMGFEVELFCGGQSRGKLANASNKVYTSITAAGETVTANDCGYRYFSMLTIEDINIFNNVEYYFIVRTYTQVGEKKYYGSAEKINITSSGFSIDKSYVEA